LTARASSFTAPKGSENVPSAVPETHGGQGGLLADLDLHRCPPFGDDLAVHRLDDLGFRHRRIDADPRLVLGILAAAGRGPDR
jgi:hypothetical protein